MKSFILTSFLFLTIVIASFGQTTTYVKGYYRANGTYVNGYTRQTPNTTNLDNWSTQGQTNPYSSVSGTRAKDYSPEAYNYGKGRIIYTGPKGGQYYINDNGNKVYVPKRY